MLFQRAENQDACMLSEPSSRLVLHSAEGSNTSCSAFVLSTFTGRPTDYFTSYQKPDRSMPIRSVCDHLEVAGYNVWFTRGAPQSVEWLMAEFKVREHFKKFTLKQCAKYFKRVLQPHDYVVLWTNSSRKNSHVAIYDNSNQTIADNGCHYSREFEPLQLYSTNRVVLGSILVRT